MKNNFLKSTFVVAIMAASATIGYMAYNQHQHQQLAFANPLLAENLEALADNPGASSSGESQSWATLFKLLLRGMEIFSVSYTVYNGVETIVSEEQVGYLAWTEPIEYVKKETVIWENGKKVVIREYGHRKECKYYKGKERGNCSPEGTTKIID